MKAKRITASTWVAEDYNTLEEIGVAIAEMEQGSPTYITLSLFKMRINQLLPNEPGKEFYASELELKIDQMDARKRREADFINQNQPLTPVPPPPEDNTEGWAEELRDIEEAVDTPYSRDLEDTALALITARKLLEKEGLGLPSRLYLNRVVLACVAIIEEKVVPYQVQESAKLRARGEVRATYEAMREGGQLPVGDSQTIETQTQDEEGKTIILTSTRSDIAKIVMQGLEGFLNVIIQDEHAATIAWWQDRSYKLFGDQYDIALTEIHDLVYEAAIDESVKPIAAGTTYDDFKTTDTSDFVASRILAARESVAAKLDAFLAGEFSDELLAQAPIGAKASPNYAMTLEEIDAKYHFEFDIFTTHGLLPTWLQTGIFRAATATIRRNANWALDSIADLSAKTTGLTEEEIEGVVHDMIFAVMNDLERGFVDVLRTSASSQEVWDQFFAYCTEMQALNQVVYRGVFNGIGAVFGDTLGKGLGWATKAFKVKTVEKIARSAMASETAAQIAGNGRSAYGFYLAKQGSRASLPWLRSMYGVADDVPYAFSGGLAPWQKWGNKLDDWLTDPAMRTSSFVLSEEEYLLSNYAQARLLRGLDPTQIQPLGNVQAFSDAGTAFKEFSDLWTPAKMSDKMVLGTLPQPIGRTASISSMIPMLSGLSMVGANLWGNIVAMATPSVKEEIAQSVPEELLFEFTDWMQEHREEFESGDINEGVVSFLAERGYDARAMAEAAMIRILEDEDRYNELGEVAVGESLVGNLIAEYAAKIVVAYMNPDNYANAAAVVEGLIESMVNIPLLPGMVCTEEERDLITGQAAMFREDMLEPLLRAQGAYREGY